MWLSTSNLTPTCNGDIPAGHAIDDETVHYRVRINHVRALLSDTDKSILDIP